MDHATFAKLPARTYVKIEQLGTYYAGAIVEVAWLPAMTAVLNEWTIEYAPGVVEYGEKLEDTVVVTILPDAILTVVAEAQAQDPNHEEEGNPMRIKPKYPHVVVQLTGDDGNGAYIIGKTMKAMRRARVPQEEIEQFRDEVTSGDYDHLLATVQRWVDAR